MAGYASESPAFGAETTMMMAFAKIGIHPNQKITKADVRVISASRRSNLKTSRHEKSKTAFPTQRSWPKKATQPSKPASPWLTSVPEETPKPRGKLSSALETLFQRVSGGISRKEREDKKPHGRRQNEKPLREKQQGINRGTYAHLLKISRQELNSRKVHLGLRDVTLASIPLEVGGFVVEVPFEARPQNLVLNNQGIPREGAPACQICGRQARKGSRTCKTHAGSEPWLPKVLIGPIQQMVTGIYLSEANGLEPSVWNQIRQESREAKKESSRQTKLVGFKDQLVRYQSWAEELIEKDGNVAWHPSFQRALNLLSGVDWALKNLAYPSFPRFKEDFQQVIDNLKEVQWDFGIKTSKPGRKGKGVEKEVGNKGKRAGSKKHNRSTTKCAGAGRNAQLKPRPEDTPENWKKTPCLNLVAYLQSLEVETLPEQPVYKEEEVSPWLTSVPSEETSSVPAGVWLTGNKVS